MSPEGEWHQPCWRMFIAIPAPGELRAGLSQTQGTLRRCLPSNAVKWVPAEQMHLTLRFLGDVPATEAAGLRRAVARVVADLVPFELVVEGLGAFPNERRPRVLWLGLSGTVDALAALQAAVLDATTAWGKRDDRPFHGHLTLGRVRDMKGTLEQAFASAWARCTVGRVGSWRVNTVGLYRSVLGEQGPVHTRIE